MKENLSNKVIIIAGPTASGKSDLAIAIAKKLDGIVINADSSQVYKEAPILTAQPSLLEQKEVPHKLFGIINLNNNFSVGNWLKLVTSEINNAFTYNKTPIIVGGTGFYLNTLINGITPIPDISQANKLLALNTFNNLGEKQFHKKILEIDPLFATKFTDKQRLIRAFEVYLETGKTLSSWQSEPKIKTINNDFFIYFINPCREILYERINIRFNNMINNGALNEAYNILKQFNNINIYKKIIGLTELINYTKGEIELNDAKKIASQKTRNYAKRQITWFKNQLNYNLISSSLNTQEHIKNIFS